jgi:hypothetical protein
VTERPEDFNLSHQANYTALEAEFKQAIDQYFSASAGTTLDKLKAFPRFVPRQDLALLLARAELFKKVEHVHGALVECGVFMGTGLFSWAQLSAIYEPYNHNRRVIGFDTFSGFPSVSIKDGPLDDVKRRDGYAFRNIEELRQGARLFDLNRPIGHLPKIELVEGDATETIPSYIADNKHLVVSLLYLDFDLYEPTLTALRHFLPRMPRGAVLAFDELNQKQWPGETLAVIEAVGLDKLAIRRMPFVPSLSYAVLGERD